MMFTTLEMADAAVSRIAEALHMNVEIGERMPRGISVDHARQLCATGAGYDDWRDLELRIGTPDAPEGLGPADITSRLALAATQIGIWDHPLEIEALLCDVQHVATDPTGWIDETLELSHLFHEDISRLEAAESIFDYIRLASDPDVDDVDVATRIALAIGMEIDPVGMKALQNRLLDKETRKTFLSVLQALDGSHDEREERDDRARLALCARASRIDAVVASMDAKNLAQVLTAAVRHIARAGGGVSSNHLLVRQSCLRPPRGTWRDHWRDQIDLPPPDDDD